MRSWKEWLAEDLLPALAFLMFAGSVYFTVLRMLSKSEL